MITLGEQQRTEICRHGELEYPHECCGLLIGTLTNDGRKIVNEIFPISNAREDEERHHRSLILPEEYMRGERYARHHRREIIGNYHSHPDHPAVPSAFDLDHAWPMWSYVIVSVLGGLASDLRAWEMEPSRSGFNSEEILEGDRLCQ